MWICSSRGYAASLVVTLRSGAAEVHTTCREPETPNWLSDQRVTIGRIMDEVPIVFVETVRPLEAPQLAGLADALRDAGFEPKHTLPREQRSAGALTFLALRVADAASTLLIEKIVATMRGWIVDRALPRLRERGVSSVTVPIYGPRGEVLAEVHVSEDS